jgi:hypothetical protein
MSGKLPDLTPFGGTSFGVMAFAGRLRRISRGPLSRPMRLRRWRKRLWR